MEYKITDKEFRAYINQLLLYLIDKPDGSLIHVQTDKQREALKVIIDADWSSINGFELTFCTCFQWIRKNNLRK